MASPGPTAVIRSPVIRTTGWSTMRPACTSSMARALTARWTGGGAAPSSSRRPRLANTLAMANAFAFRLPPSACWLRFGSRLTARGSRLLELRHVLFRHHRRVEHDLVRHLLALEDPVRDLDRLLAARRVDEGGGEPA